MRPTGLGWPRNDAIAGDVFLIPPSRKENVMLKTSAIAACVLTLSGGVALAQGNWLTNWIPPGPSDAPGGANGPARARAIGGDPNVNATYNGTTTSSSMSRQQTKWESAHGVASSPFQAQALTANESARGAHRVYITDEYGFRYDRRGNRLDARGYVIR
jgi:hypothetical protein